MGKRSRKPRPESPAPPAPGGGPLPPAAPRRPIAAILAIALAIAIVAIYAQSLGYEFTNFDDYEYVADNPVVRAGLTPAGIRWAFTEFYASNWHPLTWISHMADVSLFGLDPGRLRIGNILLHAANAILLLFFLLRATGRLGPSAAVAALFALHPLRVESVAWVSERKDVLSTFFFFLTLIFYVGWARNRGAVRYLLVTLAFILGLLAKPMLVTLPFVLLLLDWWPLQRELRAKLILEKLPWFLLIVPSAILTMEAQTAAIRALPLGVRAPNAALSYVAYLGKTFWPANLSIIYPYRTSVPVTRVVLAVLLLLAITAAVIALARRYRYLPVGWFWYVGTLVPVIGVVQVGRQAMADRYTLIPTIGILIAVVWLIAERVRQPKALAAVTAAVCLVLAILSFRQVKVWRDSVTLFRHALAVTDDNAPAETTIGREYLRRYDYASAAQHFRNALVIDEREDQAHNALGAALNALGDVEGAEASYRKALALNPNEPEYYRDLGELLVATGRNEEAIRTLETSVRLRPNPEVQAGLEAARGNVDEAIRWYRLAIGQKPTSAELHNNLGAMLAQKGDDAGAVEAYSEALRLSPQQFDARMNLGTILSRLGRADEAIDHFNAAVNLRPQSPEPHIYLALVYAQAKRERDAVAELRRALEIDEAQANAQLTAALRLPPKETNLRDYIAWLESRG